MAEEKKAEGKEEVPAGPKIIMGMPMPMFVFIALNLLVMSGGLGFIVYASLIYTKPTITEDLAQTEITTAEKKKTKQAESEIFNITFPEMTITLRSEQGGKIRYVTVEAAVVCGSTDCQSQIEDSKARVMDSIQTVIGARSYTELTSLDTKFRVKHEILERLNVMLKNTAAIDFLFINFVIQ